jgi:HEAT repeat protein
MKHTRFLSVALGATFLSSALLGTPSSSLAQTADNDTLMREMRGEATPPARDAAQWQAAYAQVLGALLPDMGGDDLGKRGNAQNAWEKMVLRSSRPGAEAQRLGVSNAMIARLGADTPLEARLWLLKMLEWGGRAEAVPALVPLLNDANGQVSERARRALANNSAPEASSALRSALDKAATPAARMALLNALGFRRDGGSVASVRKYLTSPDAGVAAQAILALAEMSTPEALRALQNARLSTPALRATQADALLEAAHAATRAGRLRDAAPIYTSLTQAAQPAPVRAAALRGLVQVRGSGSLPLLLPLLGGSNARERAQAARLTLLMTGPNAARALATALPKLTPEGKVALLPSLADRTGADLDPSLHTAVAALLTSDLDEVRGAAVRALGALGTPEDVPALLAAAASGKPEVGAAREALGRLGRGPAGAQVDARLVQALGDANTVRRAEAAKALGARRTSSALPQLVRLLDDADDGVRTEAARAIGDIGGGEQIPILVAWMGRAAEVGPGERAVQAIISRSDRTKIPSAPLLQVLETPNLKPALRSSAYRLLGFLGTREGFEVVRKASSDDNEITRDVAVRALSAWPNVDALPALLEVARGTANTTHAALALRGVARLVPQSGLNDAQKVQSLRDGMAAAKRNEEKSLMLGALGEVRSLESLSAIEGALGQEGLKEDAASAVLKIVRGMRDQRLREARPIIQKAHDAAQNNDLKRDLKSQLDRAA